MNDEYYMQIALDLARKGTGFVNPNPLVGAIIVKNGAIIGRGYHKTFGGPHAEVFALEQAAEETDGATMYVTLEPCCHQGKTPPCTRRIVAAGIRCVVVACRDPNPLVNGQGIASLQGAGVEVREGALRKEAQQVNEIFLRFITTGIPFTQLKLAMSLDGKIATKRGDSKWISGEQSREEVHRMRGRFASVLVGSNTVIVDDPRLTVRHVSGKNPIRIVLDQHGLIPITSRIFHSEERTIVVTGAMPAKSEARIKKLGKEVWRVPDDRGYIDLGSLLQRLGKEGIDSVLVEGGGETAASILRAGLVDKIVFFVAPIIIGGRAAIPAVGGDGADRVVDGIKLKDMTISRIGDDFLVTGYPLND